MATFDQALTESALIAIPVLLFLLGWGWFKWLGDNGPSIIPPLKGGVVPPVQNGVVPPTQDGVIPPLQNDTTEPKKKGKKTAPGSDDVPPRDPTKKTGSEPLPDHQQPVDPSKNPKDTSKPPRDRSLSPETPAGRTKNPDGTPRDDETNPRDKGTNDIPDRNRQAEPPLTPADTVAGSDTDGETSGADTDTEDDKKKKKKDKHLDDESDDPGPGPGPNPGRGGPRDDDAGGGAATTIQGANDTTLMNLGDGVLAAVTHGPGDTGKNFHISVTPTGNKQQQYAELTPPATGVPVDYKDVPPLSAAPLRGARGFPYADTNPDRHTNFDSVNPTGHADDRRRKVSIDGNRVQSDIPILDLHDPGKVDPPLYSPELARRKHGWMPYDIPQDQKDPAPVGRKAQQGELVSPTAVKGIVEDDKYSILADKGANAEKRRLSIDKGEQWVMGDDGIIQRRTVKPLRRSPSSEKSKIKADDEDVTIVLGDPGKAPKVELPELVRVRGLDGKDRWQKASDFDIPAKEKVDPEKVEIPAKPTESPIKEELTGEKELEKLKAELAELNKEEAKPAVDAAKGDEKEAELDKVKRLEEIKVKMAEIKAARDTAVYDELRAELAKAGQPKPKVETDPLAGAKAEGDVSPVQPSTLGDRERARGLVSSPISAGLRDRGIRRRKSVLLDDAPYAESAYASSRVDPKETFTDMPTPPSRPRGARADSIGVDPSGNRGTNDLKDPFRRQGESLDESRIARSAETQTLRGESVVADQSRNANPLDLDRQSRLALSQGSRGSATDGSIAPTGLATSSVRAGDHSSKATGDPSPLDADELANLRRLDAGTVVPGDSVSVAGHSEAPSPTEDDRTSRKGARSTSATADKDEYDMPTTMSNIGKKVKSQAAVESSTSEATSNPDADQSAVDKWLKEADFFHEDIQRDTAQFGDLKVHEAWYERGLTQWEGLSSRVEQFSPKDQARCQGKLDLLEGLLDVQADVIKEKRDGLEESQSAVTAPAKNTNTEDKISSSPTVAVQKQSERGEADDSESQGGRSEAPSRQADSLRSSGKPTKAERSDATETLAPERLANADARSKQERSDSTDQFEDDEEGAGEDKLQSRPSEAAGSSSNAFAPLNVKKKNSAMIGAGHDQQDRYAHRPAVDHFGSDLANDRRQGRQPASSGGPPSSHEMADSSNGQREVRQIVPETHRSRDNRAGHSNSINTHGAALPTDTSEGRNADLTPNSQDQDRLDTGRDNIDRSEGSKASKPDSSSHGPSPSDSTDEPTADSDRKTMDVNKLPSKHAVPSSIEYDPEDLYENYPLTRVNGHLVPVQAERTDELSREPEAETDTTRSTPISTKKLAPEVPSLHLSEKTERLPETAAASRQLHQPGKPVSTPDEAGSSRPDLYDSDTQAPREDKREILVGKPNTQGQAERPFIAEAKHVGRKPSMREVPAPIDLKQEAARSDLSGKPEQFSPGHDLDELDLHQDFAGQGEHQSKKTYALRPDIRLEEIRKSHIGVVRTPLLTNEGDAPAAKQLGPDLSRIVEHDASRQDIPVNRMMLPETRENQTYTEDPRKKMDSRKQEREVSKAPLVFPKEFMSSRQAQASAPAWTSKSRVQEIKNSGDPSLQTRRERWETAWQERSKAWFHAHGSMSESKQRATNARQEQEWERIALLNVDDDASERLEYIQDTQILLSRPPFHGMNGQNAPGSDAPPVYKPTPAEKKARWKQFSKLWKEEQASSGGHHGTAAQEREEMSQHWERVAHLPPGEFSMAMHDYRRKNDRLPWAEKKTRPQDGPVSPDLVDELRHIGKGGKERPVAAGRRTPTHGRPAETHPTVDGRNDMTRNDDLRHPEADLRDSDTVIPPDDISAQKAAAREKYQRLQREQQPDSLKHVKQGEHDYEIYNAKAPDYPSGVKEDLFRLQMNREAREDGREGSAKTSDESTMSDKASAQGEVRSDSQNRSGKNGSPEDGTGAERPDGRGKKTTDREGGRQQASNDGNRHDDHSAGLPVDGSKTRQANRSGTVDSDDTYVENGRQRNRRSAEDSDDSDAQTLVDDDGEVEPPSDLKHKAKRGPTRKTTYPPRTNKKNNLASTNKTEQEPLPSLFQIRPLFNNLSTYVMNAKILTLALIVQCSFSVLGGRQITTLVTLPAGADTTSSLAKRAPDDLPIDIRYTQEWLVKMLGGTVDPTLAFILLMSWISLCILTSGIIYNFIIEKTDNPKISSPEEKAGKWYRNKTRTCKKLGRWINSCLVSAVRLVLMDRHPSIGMCWSKSGWWTLVRIVIFTVELLLAIVVVRHVLAMASLVAGAETPIPSGPDISLTLSILKDALPAMSPGGTMFLVASVLTGVLVIVPIGWHSLLHPRPKNLGGNTAAKTLFRIMTCRAFGSGIKLATWQYNVLVSLLAIILVSSFAACLVYFVEIMNYVGEVGFVKEAGYVDSVGLIGACLIFGIFAIPLGLIALKVEDMVRSMSTSKSASK